MRVRIVNRTPQLLIVPLNSGKTVHLAPAETSKPLEHAEVNGNTKLEKLAMNNSITLIQEAAPAARAAARPAGEEQKVKDDHEPDKEPKRETRRK